MKRFLERASREHGVDLESWEFGLRSVVLLAGASLLEGLLEGVGSGRRGESVMCSCGSRMTSRGRREKRIKTVVGDIRFNRSMFVCPSCGESRFPGDELLDIQGTMFSPGVRRLMARAGQRDTFKEGRDDLQEFAEIIVTAKDVERVSERTGEEVDAWQREERSCLFEKEGCSIPCEPVPLLYVCYDGTGVPVVPRETAGRKGKQPDGSSKSREAKLGCVFTQTTVDEKGFPVRDDESTSFVGAIETSDEFGERIYAEAARRELNLAEKVAIIADGARYNWEIADLHFPSAIQIVDLYHAREHLHNLCSLLVPEPGSQLTRIKIRWLTLLDEGKVDKIIKEAKGRLPRRGKRRDEAKKQIGYLENNAHRMRYGEFREQGLFVGSGVVEAGCKNVIGKRLKQSGMEWTVRGANAIIALRCLYLSGRMEEFWEQRAS